MKKLGFRFPFSIPLKMGGRGPPRFLTFSSGFGKGGAEALLSFRVPAWSVRVGEGRGPLRLPRVRLAAGNRGAEATPGFILVLFSGWSPKVSGGLRWDAYAGEDDTAWEQTGIAGTGSSRPLVRAEMFSSLFQVCESCLVGCLMTCCHNP